MKPKYSEEIKSSFLIAFNNARKQAEAEMKQKPFEWLHASNNLIHAKICIN